MKCERAKELLMTDYADGELGKTYEKDIRQHIRNCKGCEELEKALKKTIIEPLKDSSRHTPPAYLWNNIKESINVKQAKNPIEDMIVNLGMLLRKRKPAFAFATAAAILLVVATLIQIPMSREKAVNSYLNEQGEFLNYLGNGENGYAEFNSEGLGTGIEEIFL
ncbi:MAG: zf-HC2 domain-containing protein [Candidatus Omnitrophica bacterium]|nr:zf-HC2 domain-containing protein [Candidatus Omnitrophota bacterium]